MGLRPISDGFNFLSRHSKSGWRKTVPKVLHRICVELALLWSGIQTVFSESPEYLPDMFLVGSKVCGIHEDIIQVNYHRHV
jgi:hypothetical protein